MAVVVPRAIAAFIDTPTPQAWIDEACRRLPELLLDHANCELKAASTALGFIYRYPQRTELSECMSRLAREELRHFEQVRYIMDDMAIPFARLSASRYAGELRHAARKSEPHKLLDLLLREAFRIEVPVLFRRCHKGCCPRVNSFINFIDRLVERNSFLDNSRVYNIYVSYNIYNI